MTEQSQYQPAPEYPEWVGHIRDLDEYKQMDAYKACEVAEGFGAGEDADDKLKAAAWQYIWDTGMWKSLQGFYGRQVHDLLDMGLIQREQ